MTAPRITTLCILLVSASAWAAPARPNCIQTPNVRNLMNVTEYMNSGLNKLSEKQLKALNAWLAKYTRTLCAPTPAAVQGKVPPPPVQTAGAVKRFGQPAPKAVNTVKRIESRIVGNFYGWSGNTRFRLANGQVWIQAGPGYFQAKAKNPKVVIKKLLIGYVLLYDGKEVFVRRIR